MNFPPPLRLTLTMVLVVALGVALRVLGYFDPSLQLWVDEADWAAMLVSGKATWIRPAGYMTLTGWLISIANTEPVLRSLSLVGGVGLLLLAQSIFRRVTTSSALATFGVFLLAVSPVAVSMSKEFKPYALEAAFHGALIWCVLRWLAEHRQRDLVGFVVVAVIAPLFAWSVVFAYPGLFLVVGIEALRTNRRRELVWCAAGGVVTFAVLAVIFLARVAGEDEKTGFWGKKYDVFYVGDGVAERFVWMAKKTFEVAGFPGHIAIAFPGERAIEAALPSVFAVAVLLSVVVLVVKRRWLSLAIWVLPWCVTFLFNVAGKWPYGVFRTNLFLLLYAVGALVAGLDALVTTSSRRGIAVVLGAVAVLLFPYRVDRFRVKEESSLALSTSVRTVVESILAEPRTGPVAVVFDGHACGPFKYYSRLHRDTRETIGTLLRAPEYLVKCGGFSRKKWFAAIDKINSPLTYVVVAKPGLIQPTRARLLTACASLSQRDLHGTTMFRCERIAGASP